MKLMEYEAKEILRKYGIPAPSGVVIRSPDQVPECDKVAGDRLVLKAQVEVGGRGKAGGVLIGGRSEVPALARALFSRDIKGVPVREVLVEEWLPITHEYYLSMTIDRSSKKVLILFAEAGGVEIEELVRTSPEALRRMRISPLVHELPLFMVRALVGSAPAEIGPVIRKLYRVFLEKDALLAEINPLVTTEQGLYAADAKLVVDDNALRRQGISANRDLTDKERVAASYGFSYVELDGTIGVIGNGAGLTMATLDLIEFYKGKAANFLDVGGGADQERVMHAVRLVAGVPSVRVIVVNILGGITRCDEVARGIVNAGISQKVIVRLAGIHEAEGRAILAGQGYRMLDTMDEVVKAAVEAAS